MHLGAGGGGGRVGRREGVGLLGLLGVFIRVLILIRVIRVITTLNTPTSEMITSPHSVQYRLPTTSRRMLLFFSNLRTTTSAFVTVMMLPISPRWFGCTYTTLSTSSQTYWGRVTYFSLSFFVSLSLSHSLCYYITTYTSEIITSPCFVQYWSPTTRWCAPVSSSTFCFFPLLSPSSPDVDSSPSFLRICTYNYPPQIKRCARGV